VREWLPTLAALVHSLSIRCEERCIGERVVWMRGIALDIGDGIA